MGLDVNQQLSNSTIWIIAFGVLMIVAGAGAIAMPFLFSGAIATIMAWVLLAGGFIRLVHAFQSRSAPGFWLKCAVGGLYLLVSLLLFTGYIGQSLGLTLALGIMVFIQGILEILLSLQLRPAEGRFWVLSSGVIAIVIGILLSANRPLGAVWLIGLLLGSSLIITGTWFILLALGIRGITDS
jgi:uncharacterized membrane protein HdeD (DUF308 family)